MIVGSLLLILGAVALLVFGLAGGSSLLLISSIAASLLAAVALVIGARQASARSGRAAPVPDQAATRAADPLVAAGADGAGPPSVLAEQRAGSYDDHTTTFDRDRSGEPAPPPAEGSTYPGATGWSAVPDQAGPDRPGPDRAGPDRPGADHRPDADRVGIDGSGSERADAERSPGAPHQRTGAGPAADPAPSGAGDPRNEGRDEGLAEFDPEDPADEPRAQWVAPADAAQLAVTTIEVHVVDGRPRYHVVGCPHLAGRESDALPVAEAIDLGFTPCGVCRPVDRLLATRHA